MKCDELQQRLDDYLDGDLDTILVSMLEQHVTSCESCKKTVEQVKRLQAELKQVLSCNSADENVANLPNQFRLPSDDFISSAFEKVRAHYPERQTNNRWSNIGIKTGFVTAIAAGFSLWAVLTTVILPTMDSRNTSAELATNNQIVESALKISTLNLNVNETRVIRLAIDTPDEFDKVTLSVVLPTHVELKGHKNKHELSWDTKLAKGNNILRIPLKAIKYGQGDFIARIAHNGKVKTFKLFLKSIKPDLSYIHAVELEV